MLLQTPYIPEFTGDISPLNLHFIAATTGKKAANPQEKFTFLELGCGHGLSLNMFAACYPKGQFYGIDGLESHIQNAKTMQQESGLTNVNFIHSLFDQAPLDKLPEFDFIAFHGIWAHVDSQVQQHILNIIKQKLKPGGLVYVSYDALPGYGVSHMMREMMLETIKDAQGDDISRIQQGLGYLQFLRQQNSAFFHQNPTASLILDNWLSQPVEFLIHQLLPSGSRPYFFHEVNSTFTNAGLNYLATSPLVWNFLAPTVPNPQTRQFIRQFASQEQVETQKDYFVNQQFRRDIFRLPLKKEEESPTELFENCYFGSLVLQNQISWQRINTFGMKFQYPQAEFDSLIQKLSQGSCNLSTLTQGDKSQQDTVLRQLNSLIFGEQFSAFLTQTTLPTQPTGSFRVDLPLQFNKSQLYTPTLMSADGVFVAAPALGNGVRIPTSDALIIRALYEGLDLESVPARCWDVLSTTGVSLMVNGQKLMTAEAHIGEFTRRLQVFINERLCKYAEIGIISLK